MWNELESYKHHFLQKELPHMQPVQISPLVQKEFALAQSDRRDLCRIPYTKKCEKSTFLEDHAKLAYGWFALPKLMRELCSDERDVRWRAMNSLSEFLMNPLNAQRAINEMEIVRLLKNAFLRIRFRWRDVELRMTDRLLHIFGILSIYLNGAKQIAAKLNLCTEFYSMLMSDEEHIEKISTVLRNLTEKPAVLVYLLEKTHSFENLSTAFDHDPCRPYYPHNLWVHLSHILEVDPKKGIEMGFFEMLHKRIVGRLPKYHQMNMKCFGLLLRCEPGQKLFNDIDGVLLLYEILTNVILLDTYEYVVFALLHGLQTKAAMWRCREFTDLPNIITKLARKKYKFAKACSPTYNKYKGRQPDQFVCRKAPEFICKGNDKLQLYCFKTLRHMGQMPCIKANIKANCLDSLREAECFSEQNECQRDDLIKWLEREIYETH